MLVNPLGEKIATEKKFEESKFEEGVRPILIITETEKGQIGFEVKIKKLTHPKNLEMLLRSLFENVNRDNIVEQVKQEIFLEMAEAAKQQSMMSAAATNLQKKPS